jgi:hypothetical protein
MRTVVIGAGAMLLIACSGSDSPTATTKTATSGSTAGSQQCPIDLSAPAQGQADSGPSECIAPDGAPELCPCMLPDGGPVDVCGPGGQCVVGPICTPGGCLRGWVCSYQTGGCGELVTTLCSRSCGVLTVNQAAQVSDTVVCTGDCVQQTDAATAPWVCASQLSVSCSGGPGDQ